MQVKHKINQIDILNDKIQYIGSNVDEYVFFEEEDDYIHDKINTDVRCKSRYILSSMFLDINGDDNLDSVPENSLGPENLLTVDFKIHPDIKCNHIATRADAKIDFVRLVYCEDSKQLVEKEFTNGVFKLRENLSALSENFLETVASNTIDANDNSEEDLGKYMSDTLRHNFYFHNDLCNSDYTHDGYHHLRIKFTNFDNIKYICFYHAREATLFKYGESDLFSICNRPMNISIFWNSIADLTKSELGIDRGNMFENHMPISFSYENEDKLGTLKDTKKVKYDNNNHYDNDEYTPMSPQSKKGKSKNEGNTYKYKIEDEDEFNTKSKKDKIINHVDHKLLDFDNINPVDSHILSNMLKLNYVRVPNANLTKDMYLKIHENECNEYHDNLDIYLYVHRSSQYDKPIVMLQNDELCNIVKNINDNKDGKYSNKNIFIRVSSLKKPLCFKKELIKDTVYFCVLKMNRIVDNNNNFIVYDNFYDYSYIDSKYSTCSYYVMKMLLDNPNLISIYNNSLILLNTTNKAYHVYDDKFKKLDKEEAYNGNKECIVDMRKIYEINAITEKTLSVVGFKHDNYLNNTSISHLAIKYYQHYYHEMLIDLKYLSVWTEAAQQSGIFGMREFSSVIENKHHKESLVNVQTMISLFYFNVTMSMLVRKKNVLSKFFKYRDINYYERDYKQVKYDLRSKGEYFKKYYPGYSKFYKYWYKKLFDEKLNNKTEAYYYFVKFMKILPIELFNKYLLLIFSNDQNRIENIYSMDDSTYITLFNSYYVLKIPNYYHYTPFPIVMSIRDFITDPSYERISFEDPEKYIELKKNYILKFTKFDTFPRDQKYLYDVLFNFSCLTDMSIEVLNNFRDFMAGMHVKNYDQLIMLHELMYKYTNYWDDCNYLQLVDYVEFSTTIISEDDFSDSFFADPNAKIDGYFIDIAKEKFNELNEINENKKKLELPNDLRILALEKASEYHLTVRDPFINPKFDVKYFDLFLKMVDYYTEPMINVYSINNKKYPFKNFKEPKPEKNKKPEYRCFKGEDHKESEMILQKSFKFKVVNTPIKPKKYLNYIYLHCDMDIYNEFNRDFIDWIYNTVLHKIWVYHLISYIIFLITYTVNMSIYSRGFELTPDGTFVPREETGPWKILYTFKDYVLYFNLLYTIGDTILFYMSMIYFIRFKDFNDTFQEITEFFKIFKHVIGIVRLILCYWSLYYLIFKIPIDYNIIQILFYSLFVSFYHISNFAIYFDSFNLLYVTMTEIFEALGTSIIMSLLYMTGLIFGVYILQLNATTNNPLTILYNAVFQTFYMSLMGDFGYMDSLDEDSVYPDYSKNFKLTVYIVMMFCIIYYILLYLNMIIATMGNVQSAVDEKRDWYLYRSKALYLMQYNYFICRELRLYYSNMSPFKIQTVNEELRGDENGNIEVDELKDKNVELERSNQALKTENDALKSQITNLTDNILKNFKKINKEFLNTTKEYKDKHKIE
eukprot:Mrub_00173.p1 GENE.Mrub_00173~~Mrub_00173.p1  ORF type:complete len:1491 (+),score=201.17 Mrub_00173:76-4473(+)